MGGKIKGSTLPLHRPISAFSLNRNQKYAILIGTMYKLMLQPTHFRNAIDKYIETADPGVGNQYWPIVKKVTVRLPDCDACSSGAVLVDLPGVRDSNAARDKIARDVS